LLKADALSAPPEISRLTKTPIEVAQILSKSLRNLSAQNAAFIMQVFLQDHSEKEGGISLREKQFFRQSGTGEKPSIFFSSSPYPQYPAPSCEHQRKLIVQGQKKRPLSEGPICCSWSPSYCATA
jgi:hypothetical protein